MLMNPNYIVRHSGLSWTGWIGNEKICTFNFLDDDGKIWINEIRTECEFRKNGYGSYLIQEALKEYGEIYVCTANRLELNSNKNKQTEDSRHMENEGECLVPFVIKCIEKNILKKEWVIHPFKPKAKGDEQIVDWLVTFLEYTERSFELDAEQKESKTENIKVANRFLSTLKKT